MAAALDYAHRTGVVNRDIKPENILLARDAGGGPAHPVVADFGIARALDAAGGERLTETGLALRTPARTECYGAVRLRGADPRGTGLLPNDRTHVLKFFGAYDFGLTAGMSLFWGSGTPLSEYGGIFVGPPYWSFLQPRGSAGRTPAIWDLNFRGLIMRGRS